MANIIGYVREELAVAVSRSFLLSSITIIADCKRFVKRFFELFSEAFWRSPLSLSILIITPVTPKVKNFRSSDPTKSGEKTDRFLCKKCIDFFVPGVYNENSAQRDRRWAGKRALCILTKKRGALPLFF